MKKIFIILLCCFGIMLFCVALLFSENSAVQSEVQIPQRKCVIIDAGHGGVDGGAVSCTGNLESNINLQIALRLEAAIRLLGYETIMIRRTDISVYTSGTTIAQKKVSDLKERVRIINEVHNGILISIHQNSFPDGRYYGAQVFYAATSGSDELARSMQSHLVQTVNPGSNRKAKKCTGIYLMDHIQCTGILIECGFLSNPQEEAMLNDPAYQTKLVTVIACQLSSYLDQSGIG